MNTTRKALWLAIASASLYTAAVVAQDELFEDESAEAKPVYTSYIELGAGFTDDGNGKFGEYTSGLMDQYQKDSGFVTGSFRLGGSDAESATRWNMQGNTAVGRLFSATYAHQGDFQIKLFVDQVEKVEFGEAGSVWEQSATTFLLPHGWEVGSSTSQSPPPSSRDLSNYNEVDIAYKRRSFGIEGTKRVADAWTFSAQYKMQEKDGTDVISGNQGFYGPSWLLEPIDHTIEQSTFRVDYADSKLQTGIEIHFSQFDNKNVGVTFENATALIAGHQIEMEQMALEPDNDFVRLSLDGGYNIGDTTRISWFGDWSRGEQDEPFLPVVLDEHYYTGWEEFPFESLDGRIERKSFRLVLSGRPSGRLDYRASIDYKDRDSDHGPFPTQEISYRGTIPEERWSTHVYDKESLQFKLEGGYRFPNRMKLRAGWSYEEVDRTSTEVEYDEATHTMPIGLNPYEDSTDENRFWAELKMPQMGGLSVKLKAEYSDLGNDISEERHEHVHNSEGIAYRALPTFLIEREQTRYSISADYMANSKTSLFASFEYIEDDFDNDAYGLEERESLVFNVGATFSPNENISFSIFGSHEEYSLDQLSLYTPGSSAPPAAEWSLEQEDESDTIGFNLLWTPMPDKLDIELDYTYVNADSDYETAPETIFGDMSSRVCTGAPSWSGFCTGAMPGISDKLHRFNLKLNFHLNEQTDISARYTYERRRMDDWQWGASAAYAGPIGFYWQEPNYDSQAAVLAVRYKF